jgi:signal peptidase I
MSIDLGKSKAPAARRMRTRIWATLISFSVPGIGQAFLGHYRRGAIFTLAIVMAVLMVKTSIFLWPAWPQAVLPIILLAAAAVLVIIIWAAIDSWQLARRAAVPRLTWPKRYLVYLILFLALFTPNSLGVIAPNWRGFRAPSASMVPSLQPGDYFLVLESYYAWHEPRRGDLVVFRLPCQYPLLDRANAKAFEARCDRSVDFVKRIAGLPGDRVQLKQGVVFVNDIALTREAPGSFTYATFRDEAPKPYRSAIETTPDGARYTIIETLRGEPALDNTEPVVVPLDSYFVLGDNRDDSADSRDPVSGVGYVPRDYLIGKAALIYFSIDGRSSLGRDASSFPVIRWERIGMPLS